MTWAATKAAQAQGTGHATSWLPSPVQPLQVTPAPSPWLPPGVVAICNPSAPGNPHRGLPAPSANKELRHKFLE